MTIEPLHINVSEVSQELRIRPEIYIRLVKSFALTLSEKMKALSQALSMNDRDQARMILHEIKGTSANLRLNNIKEPEGTLHQAVKDGDTQQNISKYFSALQQESERLHQYAHSL